MKAKRLFSVIIAMMLMLSCFAVTASADAIKDTTAPVSLEITLWQAQAGNADAADSDTFQVDGADRTVPTGYKAIAGSTFTIVKDGNPAVTATGETGADGKIKFTTYKNDGTDTPLPQGTYIVTNTDKAAIQTNKVATFNVDLPMTNAAGTGWEYDVKVYPKTPITTQEPTVTKQVKEKGSANEFGTKASIDAINNKVAQWKIVSTIPADITNYTKYILNDDISSEDLGTASNVAVKFYKNGSSTDTEPESGTYTLAGQGSHKLTVTIDDATKLAGYEGGTIEIIFDTTVLTSAKKIPNDVELTYNIGSGDDKATDNDGGDSGDAPTPAHDPYVWTGKINAVKIDSSTNAPIEGVTFKLLKGADKTEVTTSAPLVTDDEGKLPEITGLGDGIYYLREVSADANHELLGSDITIEINEANMTGKEFTGPLVTLASDVVTVKNIPSTKLPLTGGMGVGMFAFAGLALAFVGGVYLSKTRKSEEC